MSDQLKAAIAEDITAVQQTGAVLEAAKEAEKVAEDNYTTAINKLSADNEAEAADEAQASNTPPVVELSPEEKMNNILDAIVHQVLDTADSQIQSIEELKRNVVGLVEQAKAILAGHA